MSNVDWREFRRRCSKPNGERLGSWTAQRIARPVALRITRLVIPLGVTAHQTTLLALLTALSAACGFACGTPLGWLWGAIALEAWYVLDHVDGQLARWRGTASLDGTAFDYLMHHAVNLVIPQSVAFGLMRVSGQPAWVLVGTAWSCGLVLLGVLNDVRYKAFIQRLKLVEGRLLVEGGGGGRPSPAAWPRFDWKSLTTWCLRKSCEMHVLAHVFCIVAAVRWFFPDVEPWTAFGTVAMLTLPAVLSPVLVLARSLRRGDAEAEFAAWYRVPPDATLEFRDGRYVVAQHAGESSPEQSNATPRDLLRTS